MDGTFDGRGTSSDVLTMNTEISGNAVNTEAFMRKYLQDERELVNAYKDVEGGLFRNSSVLSPIAEKYKRLDKKTKSKIPKYCCATILLIMAISFFSAGMSYN